MCQERAAQLVHVNRPIAVHQGVLIHYDPRRANVPEDLTRHVGDLGLRPGEYVALTVLLSHRFYPDSPIFPSIPTLAGYMGCSDRTVQRRLSGLVQKGLLTVKREFSQIDRSQTSNSYNVTPLYAALAALKGRAVPPDLVQLPLADPSELSTSPDTSVTGPPSDLSPAPVTGVSPLETPDPEPLEAEPGPEPETTISIVEKSADPPSAQAQGRQVLTRALSFLDGSRASQEDLALLEEGSFEVTGERHITYAYPAFVELESPAVRTLTDRLLIAVGWVAPGWTLEVVASPSPSSAPPPPPPTDT